MAEEKQTQTEKMEEQKIDDKKTAVASENKKEKVDEKVSEEKKDKKTESKPQVKKEKKSEAIAKGVSLHASKKQCMYICKFIKGKSVDQAIADLIQVTKLKKAVPFKGEIPHRKGDMMSGRYPVKASKEFIYLLKGLKGNIVTNGLELEKAKIKIATASWASRPLRKGGMQGKRTNVLLIAKETGVKK